MRPYRRGPTVSGILQARALEWVAISFSSAWKWKAKVKSLSLARLLVTPWTAAYHAPPFMGFSRQEYWSGVPLPSPETTIFAVLHFLFLGMVLITASCTMSGTSIHSSQAHPGTLSIGSNPLNLLSLPQHSHKGFDLGHTDFNLSLNLTIRSLWFKSQSAPSLIFANCIELLHLFLQRI